jgi:uncharacterized protein DUF6790
MYFVVVTLTTVVLPIGSALAEWFLRQEPGLMMALGKWFAFWAAGIRLMMAGVSQVLRPSFTASEILGIKDPSAKKIVSELGFANVSMGLLGTLSLPFPAWTPAAALTGGLYLLLAGVKHVMNAKRGAKENLAMATDLFVAMVLAIYLVALVIR